MMKHPLLLLLALLVVPSSDLKSQDGSGRLFEKIFRGIAHAVASENGSSLVPPPIPYDSRAAQPQPSRVSTPSHSPSPSSRSWYQPPVVQPQQQPQRVPSYAESRSQQPTVIRQPSPQTQAQPPFSGWFQAPQPQPQTQPQHQSHHQPVQPRPPFSGFSPFQQSAPHSQQHGSSHQHHHGTSPQVQRHPGGLFSQFQSPQPSHRGHGEHHHRQHEHRHHGHQAQPQKEPSRVIAIRSQFQPFTIFQGQQGQRVISSRSVRPVPNQGSIVWLRTR